MPESADERRAKGRAYYYKNREERIEKNRIYRANTPGYFIRKKPKKAALSALTTAEVARAHRYGISPAQYADLLAKQNHACPICQQVKPLVVDHCHATGSVRGLLCSECNNGVGKLGDDVDRLARAIKYLEEFCT